MSRSVSYPRDAIDVVFLDWSDMESSFEFDDAIDDLREKLHRAFPSLHLCNRWHSREDHAILENRHCEFTVSEYSGLVAVAVRVRDRAECPELARQWAAKIGKRLRAVLCHGRVIRLGVASNGEAFYRRAEA